MGNSSSSEITNSITQKNINLSLIETINKNTSSIITNTVVSNQTSSQAGITQSANFTINKMLATGPGSEISGVDLSIIQDAKLTFTADDKSIQNNNIMVDYALKLVEQLQNSISNEQAAKLASSSSAEQKNDWLGTAVANSTSSDVNNKITQINKNENISKIFNQITNTIQQNSETLNFKECIMNNLQSGSFDIGEITATDGGKISNVKLSIKQSIDVIQKCVFNTIQDSNITTKIVQDFGFTVTADTTNKQDSESKAVSKAKQENLGLVSLIDSFGKNSLYSIIALVLIIFVAIMGKMMMASKGNDAGRSADEISTMPNAINTSSISSLLGRGRKHRV